MKPTRNTQKTSQQSERSTPTDRPIFSRSLSCFLSRPPNRLVLALHGLLCLLCLLGQPVSMAAAKEKSNKPPSKSEVAAKKDDLKELRGQIESLRKDVATAESKRASAADQLKGIEQEISSTQRDLLTLSTQRSKLQETLNSLAAQSHALETRLNGQQAQLGKLVYRQYVQGTPDSLRLLLNGDNPNQMARDLHYLTAIGRARSQLLAEIDTSIQRKQALADDTQERAKEMAAIEAKQKQERDKLVAQREQRKQMVEKISTTISAQRRQIGNLERDEKQLSQLIARLAKIIAAKPAVKGGIYCA